MIIVADTGPLNYLVQLGKIDILQSLYDRVFIPHAVYDELLNPVAPAAVRAWAANPPVWLELLSPSLALLELRPLLDVGEAEAITLALEINASLLLIDEAEGRTEALRRGLRIIGTLGVLRDAHRNGLLDFGSAVRDLLNLRFYVSQAVIDDILASL